MIYIGFITASSSSGSLRGALAPADFHARMLGGGADRTSCGIGTYCGGAWTCPSMNGKTCDGTGQTACDRQCQISCAAWPVKQSTAPSTKDPAKYGFCKADEVYDFAGSDGLALTWFDQSQPANDVNKNFWVFHGCDGAGLQVGDCMGDSFYIEQFGPRSGAGLPLATPESCSSGNGKGGWCAHTRPEAFVHPGTGIAYEWYNAGMWTTGRGRWPDQVTGKPWWGNMGLPDVSELAGADRKNEAFAVMFPWVCDATPGQDWTWFWGGSDKLRPFGAETRRVKCYYDNEPWDNEHVAGTTVPPVWQAFKFWKDNKHGQVRAWKIAEKTADSPTPVFYGGKAVEFTLDYWSAPVW